MTSLGAPAISVPEFLYLLIGPGKTDAVQSEPPNSRISYTCNPWPEMQQRPCKKASEAGTQVRTYRFVALLLL